MEEQKKRIIRNITALIQLARQETSKLNDHANTVQLQHYLAWAETEAFNISFDLKNKKPCTRPKD